MESEVANRWFHCSRFSGSVSNVESVSVEYVVRIIKITPMSNCCTVKMFIGCEGKVTQILSMYVYQIQSVKYGVTLFYPEYKSSRFLLNIASCHTSLTLIKYKF